MKRFLMLLTAAMMLSMTMPTMAQQKKAPAKKTATTAKKSPTTKKSGSAANNTATAKFVLGDGELGPLSIGQTVSSLPKSVPGLYDRYKYVKESYENEMEGEIENIEQCDFYKGGKKIFSAMTPNKKITSFELYEGSSFIKTVDGLYVGYPARSLFAKFKNKRWTPPYYYGVTCCVSGRYEYVMPVLIEGESTPKKATDFSSSAKVTSIRYE